MVQEGVGVFGWKKFNSLFEELMGSEDFDVVPYCTIFLRFSLSALSMGIIVVAGGSSSVTSRVVWG